MKSSLPALSVSALHCLQLAVASLLHFVLKTNIELFKGDRITPQMLCTVYFMAEKEDIKLKDVLRPVPLLKYQLYQQKHIKLEFQEKSRMFRSWTLCTFPIAMNGKIMDTNRNIHSKPFRSNYEKKHTLHFSINPDGKPLSGS